MLAEKLMDNLRLLERKRTPIRVMLVGAGTMGKAICRAIANTPGIAVSTLVTRSKERADVAMAILTDKWSAPKVIAPEAIFEHGYSDDVILDATGDVQTGHDAAIYGLARKIPFLSFSAETEALLGPYIKGDYAKRGIAYGFADGDQPGVLGRLFHEARLCGFDIRGIFNCKGFHNAYATPPEIAQWQEHACGTRLSMITSFTDGTKMALEMNIVANAFGFLPTRRGMNGIITALENAPKDILEQLGGMDSSEGQRFVDYTLGGDFKGGVFLLVKDRSPYESDLLRYFKAGGPGPWRIFYRPYHLCSFEVPRSIAETYFHGAPAIVPKAPFATTIAIAKRDLPAGHHLDGIGGFDVYGVLDDAESAKDLFPISLTKNVRLIAPVKKDEPIAWSMVDQDDALIYRYKAYLRSYEKPLCTARQWADSLCDPFSPPLPANDPSTYRLAFYDGYTLECRKCHSYVADAGQREACPACGFTGNDVAL